MVALLILLIAMIFGTSCLGQEVAPVLQQPEYAAPAVEPQPVPFQELEVGCADECVDCGPMCVQRSYWYGGVDLLATRFNYHASSTANYDSLYTSNDDSAFAVRPYLGWESSTGTGIRTRLWLFEGEVERVITPFATNYFWIGGPYPLYYDAEPQDIASFDIDANTTVSASYFDLDFYRRFYYDRTSILLGVGTKAASITSEYESFTFYREEYRAGGISVFAEGNHPLYLGPKVECAFIGYGRMSLLTGEMDYRYESNQREKIDLSMSIMEVGLGLEIKRKFRRSDFLFQIVSEIQRWETEGNITVDMSFDALGLRFGGQW